MFQFQFSGWKTPYINEFIRQGAENHINDSDFIRREINEFMSSPKRADMIKGVNYYRGLHDILKRKRTAIGEGGELKTIDNLPNNRIVNNQYKKLVDQKSNYILGQPITVNSENKNYIALIGEILNSKFDKIVKQVCEDSLNCGIGWLFIEYDEEGNMCFRRFKPWEIIPGWVDEEHTKLDYAIRVYPIIKYEGKNTRKEIIKVEIFDSSGIKRFVIDGSRLTPDGIDWATTYFYKGNDAMNWLKIPLIPFKYNANEIPLIKSVKSLQDGLNVMLSNYQNNMEEDVRNTILVLKNYDGEDLGEFRRNLATYGAVKVRTVDSSQGGVDTLNIQINSENYKVIIDILKKSIIENGMGYDAKDDRLAGNPNQMNIQSMYSDIDLDANGMEIEYQEAMKQVLWFVNAHLCNIGKGNFEKEQVEVIFNRDILINEGEAIENCAKSKGILSDETIVAQHPWIDDVQAELKKLEKQEQKAIDDYGLPIINRKVVDTNTKDDE